MTLNVPLDNFASSPLDQDPSTILAVCIVEEASKGSRCYVYSTCKLTPERKVAQKNSTHVPKMNVKLQFIGLALSGIP